MNRQNPAPAGYSSTTDDAESSVALFAKRRLEDALDGLESQARYNVGELVELQRHATVDVSALQEEVAILREQNVRLTEALEKERNTASRLQTLHREIAEGLEATIIRMKQVVDTA